MNYSIVMLFNDDNSLDVKGVQTDFFPKQQVKFLMTIFMTTTKSLTDNKLHVSK